MNSENHKKTTIPEEKITPSSSSQMKKKENTDLNLKDAVDDSRKDMLGKIFHLEKSQDKHESGKEKINVSSIINSFKQAGLEIVDRVGFNDFLQDHPKIAKFFLSIGITLASAAPAAAEIPNLSGGSSLNTLPLLIGAIVAILSGAGIGFTLNKNRKQKKSDLEITSGLFDQHVEEEDFENPEKIEQFAATELVALQTGGKNNLSLIENLLFLEKVLESKQTQVSKNIKTLTTQKETLINQNKTLNDECDNLKNINQALEANLSIFDELEELKDKLKILKEEMKKKKPGLLAGKKIKKAYDELIEKEKALIQQINEQESKTKTLEMASFGMELKKHRAEFIKNETDILNKEEKISKNNETINQIDFQLKNFEEMPFSQEVLDLGKFYGKLYNQGEKDLDKVKSNGLKDTYRPVWMAATTTPYGLEDKLRKL